MKNKTPVVLPVLNNAAEPKVLLHCCCAPCSSAILEWCENNHIKPTVFYSNSNIFPHTEYFHRLNEIKNFLLQQDIDFVEDTYDHDLWLEHIKGLENEPERGQRCLNCFEFRLKRAALYAAQHSYNVLATTLASSRWKSLEQIASAGQRAVESVAEISKVVFWNQNWRKGGLQERRNSLLKEYGFYNQQYCGCEYSMRSSLSILKADI